MTHTFKGERTLMRIFIGERDKARSGPDEGRPLYEALVAFFRARGFAGATVLRGIAGFGAEGRVHTDKILRLSLDLPIVVEVIASEAEIRAVLPELDHMIDGGLVTLEKARVILYRPHDVPEDERWRHRIEGLEAADESGDAV
jgi:PII-like signaling protein